MDLHPVHRTLWLRRWWFLPPALALALVIGLHAMRIARIQELTRTPEWSVDAPQPAADSPTGYADGRRALIVVDPSGQSQQWIAQTQASLARHSLRLDRVSYDNAPFGRETRHPLLYRAWLAALACGHGAIAGIPPGRAAEVIAFYADPLLHALFVMAAAWFVRRHFGPGAALLAGVFAATGFPLAASFVPGAPECHGAAALFAGASLLVLVAGGWDALVPRPVPPSRARAYGLVAGAIGGIGLCLNLLTALPLLLGIAVGAAAGGWLGLRSPGAVQPWRSWALGGCVVSLLGYFAQHFPDRIDLRIDTNHPLYAVAWLALGELLERSGAWIRRDARRPTHSDWIAATLSLLVLLAVALVVLRTKASIFAADLGLNRLTRLDGASTAGSLPGWWAREGVSLRLITTLLPAAILLTGGVRGARRRASHPPSAMAVLLAGAAVTTFVWAAVQARGWAVFDTVVLVALAWATRAPSAVAPRLPTRWLVATLALPATGLLCLLPPRAIFRSGEFTPAEFVALVERDLAHALAQRRPDAVVLAPPSLSASLWFYGGLRTVATFDSDNRAGFIGGLRIAGALSAQEALTLLQKRGVTHVVLPAWDRGLDEAARADVASSKPPFIAQLRDWILPLWLRPVAYFAPDIGGISAGSVPILEMVEDQSESVLVSQMAGYFVDAGLPGHATQFRPILRRYARELGPRIALAEIERLRGDEAAFNAAVQALPSDLSAGADRSLAWDRRIALAAVMAQAGRNEAARAHVQRCFQDADPARLRALSAKALYRLLALGRNFQVDFSDPSLRGLALQLLPPELRAKVA